MNQPALPAYLLQPSDSTSNDLSSGLGNASPPYISIEGNRFTLVDADGNKIPTVTYDAQLGPYVDVCLVAANAHTSRIFYSRPYDPRATQFVPPDCWSDNGVAPSRNSSAPQSPTCATCRHAEWGSATSGITGRGVPACGSYKKVACILSDTEQRYHGDTYDMIFLLRIPPNSHKNLRAFNDAVTKHQVGNRALDVSDIITRVYFQQGVQGTLMFKPVGYLTPDMVEMRNSIRSTRAADGLIGRLDQPITDPDRVRIAGAGIAGNQREPQGSTPLPPQGHPLPSPPAQAAPATLSQRAMAARPPHNGGPPPPPPPKRGRGRPRTEAPAPKDALVTAQDVEQNQERDWQAQQAQEGREAAAQQQFGIADQAQEPPSEFGAALNELFGRT